MTKFRCANLRGTSQQLVLQDVINIQCRIVADQGKLWNYTLLLQRLIG